jgi:hypothetical protein
LGASFYIFAKKAVSIQEYQLLGLKWVRLAAFAGVLSVAGHDIYGRRCLLIKVVSNYFLGLQ